jgi:hypothetical protein
MEFAHGLFAKDLSSCSNRRQDDICVHLEQECSRSKCNNYGKYSTVVRKK